MKHYRAKVVITGQDDMTREQAINATIEALKTALAPDSANEYILQPTPGFIAHVTQKGPKP